jgi:hypothetical protein
MSEKRKAKDALNVDDSDPECKCLVIIMPLYGSLCL